MRLRLLSSAAVSLVAFGCGGSVTDPPPSASSSSGASSGGGQDGHACTTIGCVDGLTVSFSPPNAWKPGKYSFKIVADGAEQSCKGALPLPACGSGRGLSCEGADVAMIGESGCALPASAHGFADVQFRSGPSKVTLRVERDGVVLADEVLTPAYRTSQPNGPSCGPICRQANATVKLQEP